jgi:hypothetical protein
MAAAVKHGENGGENRQHGSMAALSSGSVA